jgi:hypothetical protein
MKTDAIATILNQRRNIRTWVMAAVLLLLLTLAGTASAQTTNIIYQDEFARQGLLNGTTPDTADNWYTNTAGASYYTNANGNAIWFATTNAQTAGAPGGVNDQALNTDGAEVALTNTPNGSGPFFPNGYLPFKPQANWWGRTSPSHPGSAPGWPCTPT